MVGKTIDYNLSISALIGIMIIITSFFSYIGMDKPKDERLMKIGTYSATYSWYITLGFVSFLVFTGYNAHREFKGPEMLGLTILVIVSTMLVINTILNLKGDVE